MDETTPNTQCLLHFQQLDGRIQDVEDAVHKTDIYINGNGKPGIKQDLATIQLRLQNVEKVMWVMVVTIGVPFVLAIIIFLSQSGIKHIFGG